MEETLFLIEAVVGITVVRLIAKNIAFSSHSEWTP